MTIEEVYATIGKLYTELISTSKIIDALKQRIELLEKERAECRTSQKELK